jgi:hypothetical protein
LTTSTRSREVVASLPTGEEAFNTQSQGRSLLILVAQLADG